MSSTVLRLEIERYENPWTNKVEWYGKIFDQHCRSRGGVLRSTRKAAQTDGEQLMAALYKEGV